jgi:MobA/MobL family protein
MTQKIIQRSQGRSSVAHSAYISADNRHDEHQNREFNYQSKSEVAVSNFLLPNNCEKESGEDFWNEVELYENRWAENRFRGNKNDPEKNAKSLAARDKHISNAQPAFTIEAALPIEFNLKQSQKCAESFLNNRFVSRGLGVEYAIHWQDGNPHLHAQITTRTFNENGELGNKDREILSRDGLKNTREAWGNEVNTALEKNGFDARIDHRSYKDQGLKILPTSHEGWNARYLKGKGEISRIVSDNEDIKEINKEIIKNYPEEILKSLASKRIVFSEEYLVNEVMEHFCDPKSAAMALASLKMICEENDVQNLFASNDDRAKFFADEML